MRIERLALGGGLRLRFVDILAAQHEGSVTFGQGTQGVQVLFQIDHVEQQFFWNQAKDWYPIGAVFKCGLLVG